MNTGSRRYFFIDFHDLKKVKFRKLEKVCDKLFIFINSEEKSVPFRLVQQMQRFGKRARWIVIDPPLSEPGINYHLTFFMGKLHEKAGKDVEFAILSNDETFDSLVNFVNNSGGRSCLRVKRKSGNQEKRTAKNPAYGFEDEMLDHGYVSPQPATSTIISNFAKQEDQQEAAVEDIITLKNGFDEAQVVERTAQDTIQRLLRSGNRPLLVSSLRNYILLHNQELALKGNVDRVIEHLKNANEIELNDDGEVTYFF